MRLVGIDPGKKGGIAYIDETTVSVIPTPIRTNKQDKDELDFGAIAKLMIKLKPDVVYIENVHAMPSQGTTSMFNFGFSTGGLHGICETLELNIIKVQPRTWQKALMGDDTHEKEDTIAFIEKTYPNVSLLATARSKKPHDGMADALAIATYGWQQHINKELSKDK
jgi:crossover junction endodeoxyribonuclease RuvC